MVEALANILGALFVLCALAFALSAAFLFLCMVEDLLRWWKHRKGDAEKGLEPSYIDSAGGTGSDTAPPSRVAKES